MGYFDFWKNIVWNGNIFDKGIFNWWGGNGQPAVSESENKPNNIVAGKSQKELLYEIIDIACKEMPEYDYLSMSLSVALDSHKADCIAYSLFVQIACDIVLGQGKCDIVFGTQNVFDMFKGYHIWNCIYIDGEGYGWSDTTYKNWGDEGYKFYTDLKEAQMGMANYYVIDIETGSYHELDGLNLDLRRKTDTTWCMSAAMVASTEKNEYGKCYNRVAEILRKYGVIQ